MASLAEYVKHFEDQTRCNCDLDNWEPESSTGHTLVCRIHQASINAHRYSHSLPYVVTELSEPSAYKSITVSAN